VNLPIDVADLPTASSRVDLISELQTAVGELARASRSHDDSHYVEALAAILRTAAALLGATE
jgi:hypothetical protein